MPYYKRILFITVIQTSYFLIICYLRVVIYNSYVMIYDVIYLLFIVFKYQKINKYKIESKIIMNLFLKKENR